MPLDSALAPCFISAIGTPLDDGEELHREGLRAHLEDQARGQVDGILAAGTMGLLQLLSDAVYRELIKECAEHWALHGPTLAGVGDCSFTRTRDRIRVANEFKIDGVVVLAPYFIKFSQEELIDYYRALADESRTPLYLYDLPQRTGTTLTLDTVRTLAVHPNIRGIKCSGDVAQARLLADELAGPAFRVILAQPLLVDALLRSGHAEHLDGAFSIFPNWVRLMKQAAKDHAWNRGQELSRAMAALVGVLQRYGVFQAMTGILNARGIPGNFAPRPYRRLSEADLSSLHAEAAVVALRQA
ncbi:MAG: dihydrodipicolinate synthase family protein [Pirellulales bacterium]|nr:dihydrodipicolinate synthase family protein [Pirellulales bacterium]